MRTKAPIHVTILIFALPVLISAAIGVVVWLDFAIRDARMNGSVEAVADVMRGTGYDAVRTFAAEESGAVEVSIDAVRRPSVKVEPVSVSGSKAARQPPAPRASATGDVGVPVRIRIPSISVNAAIEGVALDADGSMDTPEDPRDTAWYALGPRPGETGSAAIAGHVDWKQGARAVFADLRKVRPGDSILVLDESGAEISFVVRESRRFDAEADAVDVFSSNDGKAHLNIITCAGGWDNRAKQYSERLVVFADKETLR